MSFTKDEGLVVIHYEEPPPRKLLEHWTMLVYDSINLRGVRVRIVLKSPSEYQVESCNIRLDYSVSNNQAKYEAFIQGVIWATNVGIKLLLI